MPRSPLGDKAPRLRQVFSWVNLLTPGVLLVGAFGAVVEWRPGGYILVVGLTLSVVVNVAIGVVAYYGTMNRPWPRVQPLTDDDDW
jgi:hypothetical protein